MLCGGLFGLSQTIDQAFCCELDPSKQRFRQACFDDNVICFEDVTSLASGVVRDVVSGNLCSVPSVMYSCGGFPCTDASRENSKKEDCSARRSSVADATLRTGAAFHGILQYLSQIALTLEGGLLENVLGLMDPPKDAAGNVETYSNLVA